MKITFSPIDRLVSVMDQSLRTVWSHHHAGRPTPCPDPQTVAETPELDEAERRLSGALMRVNHVGEVCAQALYTAQALATRDERLREQLEEASREETDHLAWTEQRLKELGDRPSLLNPLWYAGAFAIGWGAARLGDRASLGFVIETERQVEQHLKSHLDTLPAADRRSRAIVEQMKVDEAEHAETALRLGAHELPAPAKGAMKLAARLITTLAYRL